MKVEAILTVQKAELRTATETVNVFDVSSEYFSFSLIPGVLPISLCGRCAARAAGRAAQQLLLYSQQGGGEQG